MIPFVNSNRSSHVDAIQYIEMSTLRRTFISSRQRPVPSATQLNGSSAIDTGKPVESIEKAVTRIGLSAIGQTVLNITVVDALGSASDRCRLDPRLFWEHSIGCGIVAARLAAAVGSLPPGSE